MSSALPTIELSASEESAVRDKAWTLIERTLELEEAFYRQGAPINPKQWKAVMSTDDLHIYKQRRRRSARKNSIRGTMFTESVGTPELLSIRGQNSFSKRTWFSSFSSISESSSTSSEGTQLEDDDDDAPILCCGYIGGNLEDLHLGAYDGDDYHWKIRSAYMKDRFDDSRLVASIETPTHKEPFRFLGIKWFTVEYPPMVGTFVRKRDTLAIEALGMSVDDDGEPFGYYVLTDFKHPSLPELTDLGIVRNKLSICYISRQAPNNRMRMYARGRMDLGGDLPARLGIMIAAVSLTSGANTLEVAYYRKISWLMAKKQPERRRVLAEEAHLSSCYACRKTPRLRPVVGCQICGHSFCAKCSVERKLVVDASGPGVKIRSLSFCFGCLLEAKELNPVELARDMFVQK
ncbi:hypothetical protein Poli38472_012571 [Pythium oligandrum]|uniref:FYVE-type domain-containing protein n=1 Tax=Pythium oligandrum TaxID=41045 RepID=A0A8K1FF88_PYTOL|nr:hypothetical protein Poli38472_012571 [Pythium oligandrum]|eukprot:TMW61380.1 hypothetical protein Poli38472_012571 [Pythium oligandrum]